jgi:hypothetical protein
MGEVIDESTLLLHRISNEGLLRTFAALTHRLHAADRLRGPQSEMLALRIRAQRDRVQAEIMRRMNEHHPG